MDQRGGRTPRSGLLGPVHEETRYIPRSKPMFSLTSPAKAEMATDLAIPLVAEGGWSALTLRNVAAAANVTPQAIAAWFPPVTAMRVAIAERYGARWIQERRAVARRRMLLSGRAGTRDVRAYARTAQVTLALLPETWLERVFDGVWLTVVEAGRWDDRIGSSVSAVEEAEHRLVTDLLVEAGATDRARTEQEVDLVLAVVRGLRRALIAPGDGMSVDRAAEVLRAVFSGET